MALQYNGHEVMTYMGYIDAATGKTLVCEPGGIYDIIPETMPSDGRFTEVVPPKTRRVKEDSIPEETPEDETSSGVTMPVTSAVKE